MNAGEIIEFFRRDVDDTAAPYLWSDADIWVYLNKAEEMFCRLIGGLRDARSDLTRLNCPASQEYVALSPKILRINDARLASTGQTVAIYNYPDLTRPALSTSSYDIERTVRLDDTEGNLFALVLGLEENFVRPVYIPSETTVVRLVVERLPTCTLSEYTDCPEIGEEHHLALLDWMKHLAHKKQHAEAFSKGKSDAFGKSFREYCELARVEKERRQSKVRITMYGGI